MLGDRGWSQVEQLYDLADTKLSPLKRADDADTVFIRESLRYSEQGTHSLPFSHPSNRHVAKHSD